MTKSSDEEGKETAKISVSTGTTGGGEPAASDDDPPDKETFHEDVDFDINYQQNGRVIGTATNSEPVIGRDKRSGRRKTQARFPPERNRLKTARKSSVCVGKQPIMVATAMTEHCYWLQAPANRNARS